MMIFVAIYLAIGAVLIVIMHDQSSEIRQMFSLWTPVMRFTVFFLLCAVWFPMLAYSWFRFKEARREQRKRNAGHHVGSEGKAVLSDVRGDNRGDDAKVQTRKRPRGKVPGGT